MQKALSDVMIRKGHQYPCYGYPLMLSWLPDSIPVLWIHYVTLSSVHNNNPDVCLFLVSMYLTSIHHAMCQYCGVNHPLCCLWVMIPVVSESEFTIAYSSVRIMHIIFYAYNCVRIMLIILSHLCIGKINHVLSLSRADILLLASNKVVC